MRQLNEQLRKVRDNVVASMGTNKLQSCLDDFHDKYHQHPGALGTEIDEAWNIIEVIAEEVAKTGGEPAMAIGIAVAVEVIEPSIE